MILRLAAAHSSEAEMHETPQLPVLGCTRNYSLYISPSFPLLLRDTVVGVTANAIPATLRLQLYQRANHVTPYVMAMAAHIVKSVLQIIAAIVLYSLRVLKNIVL